MPNYVFVDDTLQDRRQREDTMRSTSVDGWHIWINLALHYNSTKILIKKLNKLPFLVVLVQRLSRRFYSSGDNYKGLPLEIWAHNINIIFMSHECSTSLQLATCRVIRILGYVNVDITKGS